MRILIVDDNDIALEMLKATLTQAGYDVVIAGNGRQALERLREGACRLIVSDWEMPEMDGIQLCQAVRGGGGELPAGYIYIILLTARDRPDERVAGLSAGADDFIVKPFNPAELLARVHTAERVLSLETRDVAIFAMAKLAESRDPETGAHLERVRGYARVLAEQIANSHKPGALKLPGEYISLIYQTSPLHDIGKVGIPDSVLLKPGRLSDREFEIMKSHTTIGAQTLEAALRQFPGVRFLEMARDITVSHHERFDGTGYPGGLKGDEIPLAGRIVALADVYDALTSKRVYKGAFAHDVAKSILLQESGSHFDPLVVDAFMQAETQFGKIRDFYSEPRLAA